MTRILFLIHDLGHGGAEKVLVNLVNNMDPEKFDITVVAMFGGGVNEQFLAPHIRYRAAFPRMIPGNSHLMKFLTPKQLHRLCVRERYDIEVSYLEGPAARAVSGCTDKNTKLVGWIHSTTRSKQGLSSSFRNYAEAVGCYNRMDAMVFVSGGVRDTFLQYCPFPGAAHVLYNTNESHVITKKAADPVEPDCFHDGFCWCGVGKLVSGKGYDRMLRIQKRLRDEGYNTHFYALGIGPMEAELKAYVAANSLTDSVTFLGYQTNPYKYVVKCDLFVCASHAEGFSTAATEALIVGTPVCTVEVSGMKEMLGENNEYGIVTKNDEDALYEGIKRLLDDPALLAHYKEKAAQRGKMFSTEKTVKAVEDMLEELIK